MTENEEQEEFSDDIDEDLIEESIRELMEMDSEGNEIDFNNYKRHVRELLEKLMMKFQSDLEYQKSLEYQVDVLNEECRQKDMEMEKLSNEAQAAINECRDQAEEMTENMLTRISHEVNKRASVERIVARLQKKLSSVHVRYFSCPSIG